MSGTRRSRLPRGFAAFRHRNYRLFWFGQLISVTGTWMQTLALSWLVLTLTSSAFKLGLVSVFQFTPILLLGLFAGVVADRMSKRRLLVITQGCACLLAAVLTVLVATDRIQLWEIYTLSFGLGVVNAFDMPTRQAFVVEMVGKDDLMNAIALNSSLFNAARIIGPAVAGTLLAVFGPALCFGLNSLSYLAVIAGLLLMRLSARPTTPITQTSGLERVREGLAYVRATPAILTPVILIGFVATFGMNFNIWVPLLARQDLDVGASGFGLLMAAMGVGSLAGALALAFFGGSGPRRRILYGAAAAMGVFELGLAVAGGFALPLAVSMLLLAAIGFASTNTMSTANTTVQTNSPDELRGRVMSVYMTVFAGTAPLGGLVAGATARAFGAPTSIAIGGVITLVAVAATTLGRSVVMPVLRPARERPA